MLQNKWGKLQRPDVAARELGCRLNDSDRLKCCQHITLQHLATALIGTHCYYNLT
jgi:hypothetical protein